MNFQSTLREKNTECRIRVDWRKRSGFLILSLSRKKMLSRPRELHVQSALREKKCGLLDVSNIATELDFQSALQVKMKQVASKHV